MENIRIQLLKKLKKVKSPLGAGELGEMFDLSDSKVKSLIKELNGSLEGNGAVIEGKTGRGNGYVLKIEDEESFDHFMNKTLPEMISRENEIFTSQEARINYIIQRFLQLDDAIKADDLAEEINVSKSQLSKDLKIVRKKLADVGIEIINRPYRGLEIVSDELSKRKILALLENEKLYTSNISTAYTENDDGVNIILAQIRTIIINECGRYSYELNDLICQNLVTHLYVAIKRAEQNFDIGFSEDERRKIEQEEEFRLARSIVQEMNAEFDTKLPNSEIYYCTIHLSSKRTLKDDYVVDQEIRGIVYDMLHYLKDTSGMDLTKDFDLAIRLSLHMVPLLSRIRYHLDLKNPLMDEIKERYILAYDSAAICAKFINDRYDCHLSDHEISYIALHIQLALNEQKQADKKTILIVCSTGRGSAMLMRAKFEREYGRYVNSINTCDYLEIKKRDLSAYDYIFSTIPLPDIGRPVIMISSFITQEDDRNITEALTKVDLDHFLGCLSRDLFIKDIDAADKEEAIRIMVDFIAERRDLPEHFYDYVMKRENLANTCFVENVALPHPYELITEESFCCIGILRSGIDWNAEDKVKLIFLCSFSKGFVRKNENFFSVLSEVISSKQTVKMLMNAESYDEFESIIRNRKDQ